MLVVMRGLRRSYAGGDYFPTLLYLQAAVQLVPKPA